MRQRCRTKPLSDQMMAYCYLDPWEHISVKFVSKSFNKTNLKVILSQPQCVKVPDLALIWYRVSSRVYLSSACVLFIQGPNLFLWLYLHVSWHPIVDLIAEMNVWFWYHILYTIAVTGCLRVVDDIGNIFTWLECYIIKIYMYSTPRQLCARCVILYVSSWFGNGRFDLLVIFFTMGHSYDYFIDNAATLQNMPRLVA